MSISLTQAAAVHVQGMLEKRGHGLGLRLATKVVGCSGFSYVVDYADDIGDDDQVFESYQVQVVVDNRSLAQLDGTEVDYVKQNLLHQGFEFRNPNIDESCGCGESFSIK